MPAKILIIDDDPNLLAGLRRQLHHEFNVTTAESGPDGLRLIDEEGPFAVVVSDMRMPQMDGVEFLSCVCQRSPDTVRMMLTGNADQTTAVNAINEGQIFRFFNKPCSHEVMAKALRDGIEQYRLVTAERELYSKTLTGCIRSLSEVLSLVNPKAFARASRVRRMARQLAEKLDVKNVWELELAAMLSQFGWITEPDETACKTSDRTPLEVSHDLVSSIPRLEGVADIVAHLKNGNVSGGTKKISANAELLRLTFEFDELLDDGKSPEEAITELQSHDATFRPDLLKMMADMSTDERKARVVVVQPLGIPEAAVLADDLSTRDGRLLLKKGQEINSPLKLRLIKLAATVGLEDIRIFVVDSMDPTFTTGWTSNPLSNSAN